jgi:serine/threonine-protein kinase
VKVLDFGLVKQLGNAETNLTNADAIVGTPLYLAPEAITAPETVDARTDLYALGAVGYFLLSGTPVFAGNSMVEVCAHHVYSAPEPLSRGTGGSISADLEQVIMGCLAKDPALRPRSAEELAHRLRACADAGAWSESDAERWWQTTRAARNVGVGSR